uniref:Variant surface glycoprotein 343 n=1 Tax=Trypanosoma brucei TaxID=5691 RepID=M4SZV2_9TRYP|nr:variant surface glycoprotein 343 [Trypanosoma brucei]
MNSTKVLLALLATTLTGRTLADNEAFSDVGWKAMCKVADVFDKAPGRVHYVLAKVSQGLETATKAKLRLKVLAAKTKNADERSAILAAAAVLKSKRQSCLGTLKTTIEKAVKAAAYTAEAKGRVHEFIDLLRKAQTTSSKTGFCLAGSNTNHPTNTPQQENCGALQVPLVDIATPLSETDITDEGIRGGLGVETDSKKTGTSGCALTKQATDGATALFQENGVHSLVGGLVRFTANTGGNTHKVAATAKLGKNYNEQTATPVQKAFHALKGIDSMTLAQCPSTEAGWIQLAATEQNLKDALATTHKLMTADSSAEMPTQQADKIITALLGHTKTDTNKITNKITATKVLNTADPKKEDKELNTIDSTAELEEILEYYNEKTRATNQAEIARLTADSNQDKQNSAADICRKIKDAKECNNKPFCSYNESAPEEDKKCQFNETKAEKSGVSLPQTQTAGTEKNTVNCASHTDKTKCEAENTGKSSPVCGWRKGKDNEPDQDKEMCRNGSFLVNNQFVLSVVSAAFVALLF